MVYIVDGIDRVGKSTLARKLASSLGAIIFKDSFYSVYTSKDVNAACGIEKLQTTLNMLVTLQKKGIHVVLDRFHLTEAVYGKLSRGYSTVELLSFDRQLAGILGDNVCLTLVKPTSVDRSSEEHGSDLSKHELMFCTLYEASSIAKKHAIDYTQIDSYVDELVKAKIRGDKWIR